MHLFLLTNVYNWTPGLTHVCCADLNKRGDSLREQEIHYMNFKSVMPVL